MKMIYLTQGQTALVDDGDYGLSEFKWYARWNPSTKSFYAQRNVRQASGRQKTVQMHRVILGIVDPKVQVDHINHFTTDNRRKNLKPTDHRGNNSNLKGKKDGKFTSKYTGVTWSKHTSKWMARIKSAGLTKYLGIFTTEEEASAAYQLAVKEKR